jgi:hypothetical protein|tara:strand:+ start:45 stop:1049 length:1005 start_codon:yes stop_codon:yes gene_type:complete
MSLGLPPIVRPEGAQPSGIQSAIRNIGQTALKTRQLDLSQQQVDLGKAQLEQKAKQSSIAQLLAESKEKRLAAKDAFEQAKEETDRLAERLVTLPKEKAIEEITELFADPQKGKALKTFAKTPEQFYDIVKAKGAPGEQKELQFKAELSEKFEGVNEFLKSGDVSDLSVKRDPERLNEKAALELSKSLRQSHRVHTSGLLKQLELANDEEKVDLTKKIEQANSDLINVTKQLYTKTVEKKVQENGKGKRGVAKEQALSDIFSTLSNFDTFEQVEEDLDNPASIEAFKSIGIDLGALKPLLKDHFEMLQQINDQISSLELQEGTDNIGSNNVQVQ